MYSSSTRFRVCERGGHKVCEKTRPLQLGGGVERCKLHHWGLRLHPICFAFRNEKSHSKLAMNILFILRGGRGTSALCHPPSPHGFVCSGD